MFGANNANFQANFVDSWVVSLTGTPMTLLLMSAVALIAALVMCSGSVQPSSKR